MKFEIPMSIGDWIQVIAIVTSLIVSIISIVQTKKSIDITKNMIKAESRPYLSFYIEYLEKNRRFKYFVIKNFGTTFAKIQKINFNKPLDKVTENFKFSSLVGGTIAPNQKFTSVIGQDFKETIIVNLIYSDLDGNIYDESFEVKTDITSSLLWVDVDTPEKAIRESNNEIVNEIKDISKTIKQIQNHGA